jgi:hypothetical protein
MVRSRACDRSRQTRTWHLLVPFTSTTSKRNNRIPPHNNPPEMIRPYISRAILLSVFLFLPFSVLASTSSVLAVARSRYSKAHSLGEHYTFDPRDGWRSVNATNLSYKNSRDPGLDTTHPPELAGRNKKKQDYSITGLLHKALKGFKGIGKAQKVKVTWYFGNMLDGM